MAQHAGDAHCGVKRISRLCYCGGSIGILTVKVEPFPGSDSTPMFMGAMPKIVQNVIRLLGDDPVLIDLVPVLFASRRGIDVDRSTTGA